MSEDLQGKYQKLATEYAKLRSQVPVLKKAVLDEQEKQSDLQENINEKDQNIRKFEQEIDSLVFRNKQLTSRVEVLQQELETLQSKGGKKSKGYGLFKSQKNAGSSPMHTPVTTGTNVIGEELQSKIEENARLHKQVYEADQDHRQRVMELQDRLTVLEAEASKHQDVLNATVSQHKAQITRLTEDKAMLEVKLQKQEKDLKEAMIRADTGEERLREVENKLTSQLKEAHSVIQDKLPFNDTKHKELNCLNVPIHDRRHQLKTKELIGQASSMIKELIQALSNFHTYCEQRAQLYPVDAEKEPMSDINKKLCHHLHENASQLRPMEQSFKTFHEELSEDSLTTLTTAIGLQEFAQKFHRYAAYLNKLLPYHLLSLEEECAVSSCSVTLETKNMELHAGFKNFFSSLLKVEGYVALLAAQSEAHCDHPSSSHSKFFQLLAKSLHDLHDQTKELSKLFNAKISLEHQLPWATKKLKSTDEFIINSLISLVACSNRFSVFLDSNMEFFNKEAGYKTRGFNEENAGGSSAKTHPAVGIFHQKAAQYLASTAKSCPDSVPYEVAVRNRKTLLSSTESRESLAQQVTNFQDRLGQLEQEKEHWMLEAQLLQMKYEKELQKVTQLQAVQGGKTETMAVDGITKLARMNSNTVQIDTSVLGMLETVTHGDVEGDSREELIKKHFHNRIADMTTHLQGADSKAVNFSAECRALHKRLNLSVKQKEKLEEDFAAANQTIAQLKDELQTTTRNYDGQLSTMTEHLAGMNEKLMIQKDEIDHLRGQLQNSGKNSKKNKAR